MRTTRHDPNYSSRPITIPKTTVCDIFEADVSSTVMQKDQQESREDSQKIQSMKAQCAKDVDHDFLSKLARNYCEHLSEDQISRVELFLSGWKEIFSQHCRGLGLEAQHKACIHYRVFYSYL